MSIASNFPAIKPTLLLDFANTEELDSRVTFTRASTATYYGTQTAKAEENLLLQSQTFDVSPWLTVAASVTANTFTAPDGTSTADKLTPDTTSAAHYIRQVVTGTAQTYAYSVFAKADGYSWLQLWDAFDTNFANFDVTNGVTGQVSAGVTSSITSVGSGWYRCTIVKSLSAASQQMRISAYDSDASRSASFTGDGTSGILLWGAQLEQRDAVTAYTPTTTQPITNYIPVLETAASGVARFDHNPTTFESLGLEIEESRTNLLTYSEQFDNAAWTTVGSSISANATIALYGNLTADKIVEDTANSTHQISQDVAVTSGTSYTFTVFAKAAERTALALRMNTGGYGALVTASFNLSAQTATVVTAGTSTSASITPVGNGWFRCSLTSQATATTSTSHIVFVENPAGTRTYTGNGYSGLYIWGAQLEAGAFATSYIPTVASQVTRAADAANMTGTNFSSWFSNMQSTLYAEAQTFANTSSPTLVSINTNAASTLGIGVFVDTSGTRWNLRVRGSADSSVVASYTGQAVNALNKAVIGYNQNSLSTSVTLNAASPTTATRGPVVADQLTIGSNTTTASNSWNGHIRKIAYYPLAVTSAQLQGLTS